MFKNAKIVGDDISQDEYRSQPVGRGDPNYFVSRSDLVDILVNPHKWLHSDPNDDTSTKSTIFGSLLDCFVLQPTGSFEKQYAVHPPQYPAKEKGVEVMKDWTYQANHCKDWRAAREAEGKTVISPDVAREASNVATLLLKDEIVAKYIDGIRRQVMIVAEWHDENGIVVPVKGLIDILPKDPELADLKTCENAAPSAWDRVVYDRDYHTQAALYMDMWNAGFPKARRKLFRHILVENSHPYEIGLRFISSEYIELGRDKYTCALRLYARCLAEKKFPGYEGMEHGGLVVGGWRETKPLHWMMGADTYDRALPRTSAEAIDRAFGKES